MKLLNPFGILESTDEMVTVDQVANGNACGCVCPVCGQPLQARQGVENTHHFSHVTNIECKPETILHRIAKRVLEDSSHIMLPDGKGYFYYERVALEKKLDGFQPDIVLYDNTGKCLVVEVAVTSFIKKTKQNKIIAADLNAIEIDLSGLARDCSVEHLRRIIIEGIAGKYIIHWQKPYVGLSTPQEKSSSMWDGLLFILILVAGFFLIRPLFVNVRLRRRFR
jgi:hypothetical protein